MQIELLAVGTNMPTWVEDGVKTYQRRLTQEVTFSVQEVVIKKRQKNQDSEQLKRLEGEKLLALAAKCDYVVALDVKGKALSTVAMAEQLQSWQNSSYHRIGVMVGGAEGLSTACLKEADTKWSLSSLTFPHPLVRVIVAEQVYRAWTILKSHPYHKA